MDKVIPVGGARPRGGHSVFTGSVWHTRQTPAVHSFSYPLFMLHLDVASLSVTGVSRWLLGIDGPGLVTVATPSFLERARLDGGGTDLIERVYWLCERWGFAARGHQVAVVTFPRFCGYTFNPVHFYLLTGPSGSLEYLISEVHNTFGEVHPYGACPRVCRTDASGEYYEFQFPKVFFVSPFLSVSGTYTVVVRRCGAELSITVDLEQEQQLVFSAGLVGQLVPLTNRSLVKAIVTLPGSMVLTMVRISFQALVLLKKRVAVHLFPRTIEGDGVRPQSIVEVMRFWVLSALTRGRFRRE